MIQGDKHFSSPYWWVEHHSR